MRLALAIAGILALAVVPVMASAAPAGLSLTLTNADGCHAPFSDASQAHYLMTVDGTFGDDDVIMRPGDQATFCAPAALADTHYMPGEWSFALTFREPHPSVALPTPTGAIPSAVTQTSMQACDLVSLTTEDILADSFDITVGVESTNGAFTPVAATAKNVPACLLAAEALPSLPLFWTDYQKFQASEFTLHPGDSLALRVHRPVPNVPHAITGTNAVLVATPVSSLSSQVNGEFADLNQQVAPVDQQLNDAGITPVNNPTGGDPLVGESPLGSGLGAGQGVSDGVGLSALNTPGSGDTPPPVPEIPSFALVGVGLMGALLVFRRAGL